MHRLLIITLWALSLNALASVTDEALRFKKCYSLFVREVLPQTHPLLLEVKSARLSGTDACMRLFDQGALGANNEIRKDSTGAYDATAQKIIRTFNHLHQSFFELTDYSGLLMTSTELATLDVIDVNESSYHLTYTLLKPNEPYHKVITRDHSFWSLRYSQQPVRTRRLWDFNPFTFRTGDPRNGDQSLHTPWAPEHLPETGLLVGIKPAGINPAPVMLGVNATYTGADMNQHFGAGVIGTQAYLLSATQVNFGDVLRFSDGGLMVNRRWSKRVFNDLLCRQIPVLRSTDIVSDVNMNSNLSFRKGFSCMGCHSTMDPMAGTLRNITSTPTISADSGYVSGVRFFVQREPDMPAADYPVMGGNADFYRSPASGRLKYRNYEGRLVSHDVQSLQELGEAIAEEDDLYACAAKRYYEFLTGIPHTMNDPGDFNTPKPTPGEALVRERIIHLGQELKQHQNLRELFRSIIQSETFLSPSQGV